ncbi:prepilin peptidase [Chengkuizengella axinellae]|uniref:A24 family peptidase n=1 Tax=Chengkuizengella axinellae TaxID=3064388 RepID=A0ABT9J2I6_9BACL|nr:A24 family peptidase [Chengkuizengella sp. 2205SS18-9]MDP5275235.1 A24 family peptidase [Chengkuizengella sp. 2205SS18-9]
MSIFLNIVFWSVFLFVAIFDARYKIIPNTVPIILGISGFFLLGQPMYSLYGAFIGGGILLIMALFNQDWVGGGDVKILLGLGIAFGLGVMWILWIACLLALAFTLIMRRKSMAFAPFLFLSALGVQLIAVFAV